MSSLPISSKKVGEMMILNLNRRCSKNSGKSETPSVLNEATWKRQGIFLHVSPFPGDK